MADFSFKTYLGDADPSQLKYRNRIDGTDEKICLHPQPLFYDDCDRFETPKCAECEFHNPKNKTNQPN